MYTRGGIWPSNPHGRCLPSLRDSEYVLLFEAFFGSIRAICVGHSVVVFRAGNFVVENPPTPTTAFHFLSFKVCGVSRARTERTDRRTMTLGEMLRRRDLFYMQQFWRYFA
jgi:hypothetical protein